MAKDSRSFTIIVLPSGSGRVVRFEVSERAYRRLKLLGAGLLLFVLLSTGYTFYNLVQIPYRSRLNTLLMNQRIHLAELKERLEQLEFTLRRMEGFERKVRTILGTREEPQPPAPGGIGGPEGKDLFGSYPVPDPQSRALFMELKQRAGILEERSRQEEFRIEDLFFAAQDQRERLASTPSIMPTQGWMSSEFGVRENPFTGSEGMHEGVDIANHFGSPVVATADGYVLFAGEKQGYGRLVVLEHGFGISTLYGHLSEILVREGMDVRRGEMIGRVGSTGRSTGPHLHYEVRIWGVPVNPRKYFLFEDAFLP